MNDNLESQPTLEINPQFEQALKFLEIKAQSLFITGKAGTGKSTLLSYFTAQTTHEPVLLAPTGVAALNVKGQTIHSFFNFYVDVTPEKIINQDIKPKRKKIYKQLSMIIIDEVSMLRADLLDCIDVFLRMYGPNDSLPFGGVTMVFVGDLYQLPPVVTAHERHIFSSQYTTPYFFSAHVFKELSLEVIELEKVYRQKDQNFLNLLNRIRNNSVEPADLEWLNQRHQAQPSTSDDDIYISLTTTNARAETINDQHLNDLKGDLHESNAEINGQFSKEYYPTSTCLQYKIGSQIMLLNNDSKKRWVNGSVGIIEALKQDKEGEPYLKVRLQEDGRVVPVHRYTWEIFRFFLKNKKIESEAVGTFSQYPFRLAWAVTIHKSQGKTFHRVIIDLDRGTFASGQLYVGLSRCTSFEGLILKTPVKQTHIRTDPRIYKFLTSFHYRKALKALTMEQRIALIEQAIESKQDLHMTYLKANDTKSHRKIIPLSVGTEHYQGKAFPGMRAFCLHRRQERMFHVGRILSLEVIPLVAETENNLE